MKAKEYYDKLKTFTEEDEFYRAQEQMMYDLVHDAELLIKTRNAKSNSSIKSCILEVDKKFKAICRLHSERLAKLDDECCLKCIEFLEDGFKAIYVELHPEHEFVFDLESHKKKVQEENKKRKNVQLSIMPYRITPLKDINESNIVQEILCCLAALGNYTSNGINPKHCVPLAQHIAILRYWKDNGINYDDISEFEKDPFKWIQERGIC